MRITLLSAAVLASSMSFAATPVDGWYTSFFGGYAYYPGNINIINNGFLYNNTSYTEGYNVGARVGYQSNPIRYEGEYTYLHGNTDYFNINNLRQTGVSGYTSGNLLMANLYYDCPEILSSVSPFLGVGIGYASIQSSLNSTGPLGITAFKVTDNKFAYQGTAGLTFNFAENYAANISYRYVATTNASEFGQAYQANLFNAGVIYHFDQGNYK